MLEAGPIQVGAAPGPADGFGPLKAVLGAISAIYGDQEVSSKLLFIVDSLTSSSAGDLHRSKQD